MKRGNSESYWSGLRDVSAIKMKAHITSFSLSHKSVVEFSGLLILIQFGIQSDNIHTKIILLWW